MRKRIILFLLLLLLSQNFREAAGELTILEDRLPFERAGARGPADPQSSRRIHTGPQGAAGLNATQRSYKSAPALGTGRDGDFWMDKIMRGVWAESSRAWATLFSSPRGEEPPASAVDVSACGAVGDGVADDTTAIHNAIAAAPNGGRLKLGKGKIYKVSGALQVTKTDWSLYGQGATVKAADGMPVVGGNNLLYLLRSTRIHVYDLTVDGNRDNRKPSELPAHDVEIQETRGAYLYRVRAINAVVDGFNIRTSDRTNAATYSTDVLFEDCEAENSWRNGMSIVNGWAVRVVNGSYRNSRDSWPQTSLDIESDWTSAQPGVRDVVITGAHFTGNYGWGIALKRIGTPTNITVEKNYLSDNALGAIQVGAANSIVRSNLIENFSRVATPVWNNGSDPATRGMIDLPAATDGRTMHSVNANNLVTLNVLRNVRNGRPVIYSHAVSGPNNQITLNCMESFNEPSIQNFNTSTTVSANLINPAGGCPAP